MCGSYMRYAVEFSMDTTQTVQKPYAKVSQFPQIPAPQRSVDMAAYYWYMLHNWSHMQPLSIQKQRLSGDTVRVSVKVSKRCVRFPAPATRETTLIPSSGKSVNYCDVGTSGSMVVERAGGKGGDSNGAESIRVPQQSVTASRRQTLHSRAASTHTEIKTFLKRAHSYVCITRLLFCILFQDTEPDEFNILGHLESTAKSAKGSFRIFDAQIKIQTRCLQDQQNAVPSGYAQFPNRVGVELACPVLTLSIHLRYVSRTVPQEQEGSLLYSQNSPIVLPRS